MKKFLLFLVLVLLPVIAVAEKSSSHSFIIIGNTAPDSPYSGFYKKIYSLMDAIKGENARLVVHMGNVVRGGYSWMGIKESDVMVQVKEWHRIKKRLSIPVYEIKGESDQFNDTFSLFTSYSGNRPQYVVHLGDGILIMTDTAQKSEKIISFITKTLEKNKNVSWVLIFGHENPGRIIGLKKFAKLFGNYPIVGVIHSSRPGYSHRVYDDIPYFRVGTSGVIRSEKYYRYNNYFILTLNDKKVTITPGSIGGN
jgi:hypothetical protein